MNRYGVYSHSPRLAPVRLTGSPGLRFALPWAISDTPSGLWEDDPNRAGSFPGLLFPCTILLRVDSEHTKLAFYVFSACMEVVSYQ